MKKNIKYMYNNENRNNWLNHLEHSHLNNSDLNIKIVNNALCIPDQGLLDDYFKGGIYDNDNNPIYSSFQRTGGETAIELLKKADLSNVDYIDKRVVYLGQYRVHYGSFLIDSIARLWYALDNPEKYDYIFLSTQSILGTCLHKSATDFLSLLGIKEKQVSIITKPTRFKEIIIPDLAYIPLVDYHQEYLDIIKKVVSNIKVKDLETYNKIYFSRAKFSKETKSDFGEIFIDRLFKENGYTIIYPEEHTLEEQIYYVNNCKVFASVGGSCAHNVIFSFTKPKTIIFNRMNGYQFHQWFLDEMAGVEPITYVDAYVEPYKFFGETMVNGPFLFWLNKNVKEFAKDNSMTLPKISIFEKAYWLLKYTFYYFKKALYRIKKEMFHR